jgi:hypothetical protein
MHLERLMSGSDFSLTEEEAGLLFQISESRPGALHRFAVRQLIRGDWFAKVAVMSEHSTEQIRELLDSLYRVDSGTDPGNSGPLAR